MARVALTLQNLFVDPASVAITLAAPNATGSGNGNTFASSNAKPALLLCKNAVGGDPAVVTVISNGTIVKGVAVDDMVFTIAPGETRIILAPPDYFASSGIVAVDTDNATDLDWAAFKIGKDATAYSIPFESVLD